MQSVRLFLRFLSVVAMALVLVDPASGSAASARGEQAGKWGANIDRLGSQKPVLPPVQSKVSSVLSSVLAQIQSRGITRENARARGAPALSNPLVRIDADGTIQIYVHVSSLGTAEKAMLRRYEADIEIANEELGMVQAWIPFDRIEEVASLQFVTRITPPNYATPRAGSVTTEGDAILKADALRALGVDGSGVKVGVISNGANNRASAQATGDLPGGITTFGSACDPFFFGVACDEGTALMEIVHDLAPGAQLGFGAAATDLEFIQRVGDLVNTFGADVVVDDLGFFGAPYFADGPLAQAVAAVKNQVVYVSAAGNDAQGHYEANYVPGGTFLGVEIHDFGVAAGGLSDSTMNVLINPGGALLVFLQWNDPFGGSGNNYDLALINEAENDFLCLPFCVSTGSQTGFQDPIEVVTYVNDTGSPVRGKVVVGRFSGLNRRLEMFLLHVEGDVVIEQYNIPVGSVFGHKAVPGVLAVGAIDAEDPGHDNIEPFSSRGPSRIDFPSLENRQKPDITAIDNVSVSGAGGFPTRFIGTSAAAPHVAGIAALLKQTRPSASPAKLRQALENGAVDLGAAGPDNVFGRGRVDGIAAHDLLKPKGMPWLYLLLLDD